MNSPRSAIRDLLVAQAIPLGASLLTTLATAQFLGVDGRGQLALVVGTATLLASILFASIHIGVGRGQLRSYSQPRVIDAAFTFSAIVLFGGLVALIAVWAALPEWSIGAFSHELLLFTAVGTAIQTMSLVVLRSVQVLDGSRLYRNAVVWQSVLFAAVGISVAFATGSARYVLLVWITSSILCIVGTTIAAKITPARISRSSWRRFRLAVSSSLPAHFASLGQQLMLRSDIVLLGVLASTADVGLYSVAAPLAGLVWIVAEAASMHVTQRGFGMSMRGRYALWLRSLRYYFLAAAPTAVLIAASSYAALAVLLPAYAAAWPLVLLLLPGTVIHGVARITVAAIATTEAAVVQRIIGVTSAALALAYVPAIVIAGATGAATASTIVYVTQTIIVVFLGRRVMRVAGEQSDSGSPQ